MLFNKLVAFFSLIFLATLSSATGAAIKECVLAPTSYQLAPYSWLANGGVLTITQDVAGNRRITSNTETYYVVNRFVGGDRYSPAINVYHNSGFSVGYTLELPAQFEYEIIASNAINMIDGVVFGSVFSRLTLSPMQNAQFTGDEKEIIKLHQRSTGNDLFVIAPIISVTSPDSFRVDVPEESVQNIAVQVEDIDPQHRAEGTRRIACFVDGAKSGDTVRITNNPHDRTLYLEAYTYVSLDSAPIGVAASSLSLGRIYQSTAVLPPVPMGPPTCSHAAPQAASTASTVGFAVYAYGVSSDVTSVFFPTWGDTGGQDDLIWYEGVKQADGTTWKAMVYLVSHKLGNPEYGQFNVHVYMNTATEQNQWCGTANFRRN